MKQYLINLFTLLDIALNVILLGGSPYETISGRVQKRVEAGDRWACVFCRFLGFASRNPKHCIDSRVPDSLTTNSPNWWKL